MNAQEAMNRMKLGRLRRALQSGAISPEQLQRQLSRAIEQEMDKGAKRMDTRFISACEELLWQLNPPATQYIPQNKRASWQKLQYALRQRGPVRPLWPRLRVAALAMSMLLVLGGGLWLAGQRPPSERKHSSLQSPYTPSPDGKGEQQSLTAAPSPVATPLALATPTPSPTPSPQPTPQATAWLPSPTPELLSPPPATPRPEAREKYRSIQQLREEAPQRWQHSYQAHGRQIDVDVPIVIPDLQDVAALKLHWVDLKAHVLGEDRSIQQSLIASYPQNLTLGDGFMGSLRMGQHTGERRYFFGPADSHADVIVLPGQRAAGSGYPEDAPFKLLKKLLAQMKLPTDDIVVDAQAGTSGFYYARTLRGNEKLPDIPYAYLNQDRPAQGFEGGYYRLSAMQMLRGLPLFPMEYMQTRQRNEPIDLYASINMKVFNDQNFDLHMRLVKESGIREAKLPLMNIQAVIANAEKLIEQGLLRRVDSLELGYMLYYAQHLNRVEDQAVTDELVALPVWRLRGILASDSGMVISQSILDEAGAIPTSGYLSGSYELRFNAQTGEYINPASSLPSRANPAILTWEQMEQSEKDIELF